MLFSCFELCVCGFGQQKNTLQHSNIVQILSATTFIKAHAPRPSVFVFKFFLRQTAALMTIKNRHTKMAPFDQSGTNLHLSFLILEGQKRHEMDAHKTYCVTRNRSELDLEEKTVIVCVFELPFKAI